MSVAKIYNSGTGQWEPAVLGAQGPTGPTGPIGPTGPTGPEANVSGLVSQTNGTVTTASVSSVVVRNIAVSTSDPSGGSDGDVWLKYTP